MSNELNLAIIDQYQQAYPESLSFYSIDISDDSEVNRVAGLMAKALEDKAPLDDSIFDTPEDGYS